jgi:hypothetical protein
MVDNDAIDPESVDTIKDSIEYYIDCHHDADFVPGPVSVPQFVVAAACTPVSFIVLTFFSSAWTVFLSCRHGYL